MTVSPPTDGVRRRRPVARAVTLMFGPLGLAFVFLVIGLYGSLAWVYLSMLVSLLAVPCFAVGVYLLVRRRAVPLPPASGPPSGYRFNSPPGWPPPPPGWAPPPGWQPDPSWPAAPADWQWWAPAGGP